jgi:hypothetical protein
MPPKFMNVINRVECFLESMKPLEAFNIENWGRERKVERKSKNKLWVVFLPKHCITNTLFPPRLSQGETKKNAQFKFIYNSKREESSCESITQQIAQSINEKLLFLCFPPSAKNPAIVKTRSMRVCNSRWIDNAAAKSAQSRKTFSSLYCILRP